MAKKIINKDKSMSRTAWQNYYGDANVEKSQLHQGYVKAFLDGAVRDDESFAEWCRSEYDIYLENPDEYEPPYSGMFD